ncbi:multiple sugar transport system permease protein [Paenibacillus castaneae]|uniref:carbohydrate ABC transporter permease n=1 Tax=Paenibacillus castaneae TaxID=474957 RepID=UPI000C9AA077|nr:carbohydrate ABC transporter permease [Paenibacillus castaneae]NIK80309.1 multiple sugar transport system permease protein [Paenibacillus castaneae]
MRSLDKLYSKSMWTLVIILIIGLALLSMFPFIWMFLNSLKSQAEINLIPPHILPERWMFENYIHAWFKPEATFGRYFINSTIVAGAGTLFMLAVCIPISYAISHFSFKGSKWIFFFVISTMMIPSDITIIPNFVTLRHFPFAGNNNWLGQGGQGFYDSYMGIMLPFFASAFSIFLLRQAFLSVPKEYFEASQVDGMTYFRYLCTVLVPLSAPSIVTASLFSFIGKWNSVLWPLLITSNEALRPLQVGLLYFVSEEGHNYHHLMAAATFTIVPIVVLYIFAQKWFHSGAVATGLKG